MALGDWNRDGELIKRDDVTALKWYAQAHDLGHLEAAAKMGWMYANGRGVAKDPHAAVQWYILSAERNIGWAELNLARLLAFGPADLRDLERAVMLIQRAITHGEAKFGHATLAHMYEKGLGVTQDFAKSEFHYLAAIEAGNTGSVADDADLEEVYNTERHLLYVACTRARDHLLVTGIAPVSEFVDDFLKGP